MPKKFQLRWSKRPPSDNAFTVWMDTRDVVERFVDPAYVRAFDHLEKSPEYPLGALLHHLLIQELRPPTMHADVTRGTTGQLSLVTEGIASGKFLPCAALELGQLTVPVYVVVQRRRDVPYRALLKLPLYSEKDMARADDAERLAGEIQADLEESAKRLVS